MINARLDIVRHLSCGLNISLPFLVENGLDQFHSQGVLLWSSKRLQFPLYRNMSHAHQVAQTFPPTSAITLGNSTAEVSHKIQQTIPPCTGKLINATISGKAIVREATDTVFLIKILFSKRYMYLVQIKSILLRMKRTLVLILLIRPLPFLSQMN